MALPTKLSYNPLTKLENIIWGRPKGTTNNMYFADTGCLRNYDTVTEKNNGWEQHSSSAPISAMPFIFEAVRTNSSWTTYNLDKNTKLVALIKDLVTYYPLYYAFGIVIYINKYNESLFTDKYYSAWEFFNFFAIEMYFKLTTISTYNKRIDCSIYFKQQGTLNRNTILYYYDFKPYIENSNGSSSYSYYLALYLKVTPFADNANYVKWEVLNKWYHKSLRDTDTFTSSGLQIMQLSNPNFNVRLNANGYYDTGLTKDYLGGCSSFIISPKPMTAAQIKTYLSTATNSNITSPVYDIDDYLGETNIKPNLIRHVYNDDPLCFIFG